ncbi:MAG: hypothetical protein JW966_01740 [Anaerolineae bacterium]|nr:hypothetical protein [Anaerolineae bacterium]
MRNTVYFVLILLLSLGLAACDSNNGDHDTPDAASQEAVAVESTAAGPQIGLNSGPSLEINTGGEGGMPGCNDPNDTECPAPVHLDLDADISAGGVTIGYATRYFAARSGDDVAGDNLADGSLIVIEPNDAYAFDEDARFTVFFTDSVETALAELADPLTVEWDTGTLTGMIGVVRDREQDPPVNTAVGAFDTESGQAVVLRLVTTGKYGWDLYSLLFEQMLASLAVE